MKKIFLYILFVLTLMTTVIAVGEVYEGSKVYKEDNFVYLSADPSTLDKGLDSTFLDVEAKTFDGEARLIFGFNTEDSYPLGLSYFNENLVSVEHSLICDDSDPNVWYNYTLSPNFATCFNATSEIWAHSFSRADLTIDTIYFSVNESIGWTSIANNFESLYYNFDNKNKWYYADFNVQQGKRYKLKLDMKVIGSGKYDYGLYPTSYGLDIESALTNNHLYFLDPLWNVSENSHELFILSNGTIHEISNYSGTITNQGAEVNSDSITFKGLNDYLAGTVVDGLSFGDTTTNDPFSISVWIKMNSSVHFPVIDKASSTSAGEWGLYTGSTNDMTFALFDGTTSHRIGVETGSQISAWQNKWLHLAVTYDGGTSYTGMRMYLNNTNITNLVDVSAGTFVAMHPTTANIRVAGRRVFSTKYANGSMQGLRVFNTKLTASQVNDIYSLGKDHNPEILTAPTASNLLSTILSNESEFIMYNKTVFDRFEPVYTALNYTDSTGQPILNASCNITLFDLVENDNSVDTPFSLCQLCTYDNYFNSFELEYSTNVKEDFIEVDVCHNSGATNALDLSFVCGANTFNKSISASQIPLCSSTPVLNVINFSVCNSFTVINLTLDNNAIPATQGHTVRSLRYLRELHNHTESTDNGEVFYNTTLGFYTFGHPHYYNTVGSKAITSSCGLINSTVSLTIENIAPVIVFDSLLNDCNSISQAGNIEFCSGHWDFIVPIFDENAQYVFYNVSCETGEFSDNVSFQEWQSLGLVLQGDDFRNFSTSQFCSFYISATDSYQETTIATSNFTIVDTIKPNCTGLENVFYPTVGEVSINISCQDERLNTFNISCFDLYNQISSSEVEFGITGLNTSYVYTKNLFLFDSILCSVNVFDFNDLTNSYSKLLIFDVQLATSGDFNASIETGVCPNNIGSLGVLGLLLVIGIFVLVLSLLYKSVILGFFGSFFIITFGWSIVACSTFFGVLMMALGVIFLIFSWGHQSEGLGEYY